MAEHTDRSATRGLVSEHDRMFVCVDVYCQHFTKCKQRQAVDFGAATGVVILQDNNEMGVVMPWVMKRRENRG